MGLFARIFSTASTRRLLLALAFLCPIWNLACFFLTEELLLDPLKHEDHDGPARETLPSHSNFVVDSGGRETQQHDHFITDILSQSQQTENRQPPKYLSSVVNQPYPRPRHACRSSLHTSIPYCHMANLQINLDKIFVRANGGENVTNVMGQAKKDEFPEYQKGAFVIAKKLDIPANIVTSRMFYVKKVLKSLEVVPEPLEQCGRQLVGTTLLLTRWEYCNLWHTITDWFNAFLSLPEDRSSPINVIFLDAHPKGNLDPVWTTLWGNTTYIKQWSSAQLICIDSATFVPAGYASALFPKNRAFLKKDGVTPAIMDGFVNFFVQGHGLEGVKMEKGKVVIVDRVPYLAHPRSVPKRTKRMIHNFDQVADALKKLDRVTSVEKVFFEHMTFAEQLEVVRSTHILVGNHGAGLAHLIFLHDGAMLMEFEAVRDNGEVNGMMKEFSKWKPNIQHVLLPEIKGGAVPEGVIRDAIVPQVQSWLN